MKMLSFTAILFTSLPIFAQLNTADVLDEPIIIGSIYDASELDQSTFIDELMAQNEELIQVKDSLKKEIEMFRTEEGTFVDITEISETIQICKEMIATNNQLLEGKTRIRSTINVE